MRAVTGHAYWPRAAQRRGAGAGQTILKAGTNLPIPPGADIIDLGSALVLQNYTPNFGSDETNMLVAAALMSKVRRALLEAAMGCEDLEAGIATVRDLGNSGLNGDVTLRDVINQGQVVSSLPRALTAAGGRFGQLIPQAQALVGQGYVAISGVAEARGAVHQALYEGATASKSSSIRTCGWCRLVS
jgi:hypothetical protein